MAINSEIDGLVTVQPIDAPPEPANGHTWPSEAALAEAPRTEVTQAEVDQTESPATALDVPAPGAQPEPAPSVVKAARVRSPRPRWLMPATIAAFGLIVAGTLGYFLYATTNQRDVARHQLAATQSTLASTQQQVSAAQADAASKKLTADYVSMYVADNASVQNDYAENVLCSDYSSCRTAAQQMLTDLEAFQSDRLKANVPVVLASSDNTLGDSLSAGIAGVQELINGMDQDNLAKIKDGGHKVDVAMSNMDKAQVSLGSELR
jgi:uncharacterized membrane-anchored protein YhcB (DUF1043 family)